jgi:aminoglycoside 3-N-acetyltransferase
MKADPKGILMVHVGYKSIGDVEGRGDAVLDALSEYQRDGILLFPGHTWANIKRDENPVMDVRTTETCVGTLPELFRKRKGVHRSLHPTHSLCGLGRGAQGFLEGDHLAVTPCGPKTAYYRMYERGAQILLIGVRFNRNTFIHCVEEMMAWPGRLSEDIHPLYVVDYGGEKIYTPQYRHCYDSLSPLFSLEDEMIEAGAVTVGRFGDAECLLCDARLLADGIIAHMRGRSDDEAV